MPIRKNLPNFFAMTDREDGNVWYLTHDADDERFAINDSLPAGRLKGAIQRYEPYHGPIIAENPRLRLLIRNGRIGYEVEVLPQGVSDRDQARITTRRGVSDFRLEVHRSTWQTPGDVLGYRSDPE